MKLSKINCSGQSLWLFILTCPQRHSSGIFRLGKGAIYDHTKWAFKDIDKAFEELFREGLLEAFEEANLIRLVNFAKYPVPGLNPNICKSWGYYMTSIPDCELKAKHLQELKALLEGFSEAFIEAFTKGFGKSLPLSLSLSLSLPPQDSCQKQVLTSKSSPKEIIEVWNELADKNKLPKVLNIKIYEADIRTRLRDDWWAEHWREAMEKIPNYDWMLHGSNDRPDWRMSITTFLRPKTVHKIISGEYGNQKLDTNWMHP